MPDLTMLLKRYIRPPHPSRQRAAIDEKARAPIAEHGDGAYYLARDLTRADRPLGARKDETWTKVAVRIAALTKHEIGLTGSDRRPPL